TEEAEPIGEPAQAERQPADVDDGFGARDHAESGADRERGEEPRRQPWKRAQRNAREQHAERDDRGNDTEHCPRRRDRDHEGELGNEDELGARPQPSHERIAGDESQERELRFALRFHVPLTSSTGASVTTRPFASSTTRSSNPVGKSRSWATTMS